MKMVSKHWVLLVMSLLLGPSVMAQVTGTINTDQGMEKYIPGTIVYIEHVDEDFPPPSKNPQMNQKGLMFVPRILPVVKGTTVDFLNSDDVLHNVFSPDACVDKFNLGTWPKNEIRSFTFKNEGCESVLLCNVHPEMEAFILVLQNPYFSVVDASGKFSIDQALSGKYILNVWNERLRAKAQEINIPASGRMDAAFFLKK